MNIMTLSNAKVLIRTYEPYCTMLTPGITMMPRKGCMETLPQEDGIATQTVSISLYAETKPLDV